MASARTALMGSACETTTTVWPGWRAARERTVPTTRAYISCMDSPPGNRKPLG